MELKREKIRLGEPYTWTNYMSLPFTQNVSHTELFFVLVPKRKVIFAT